MFTAVVERPGREPVEITPITDSVQWSTVAVGGFSACSFQVPTADLRAAGDLSRLSTVRLLHGPRVLWEGRIEDTDAEMAAGELELRCFGYQRLLDDLSLKRIWIMRSIPWQLVNTLEGTGKSFRPDIWGWSTVGRFDDSDLARSGMRISSGFTPPLPSASAGDAHGASFWTDAPLTRLLFDHRKVGSDPVSVAVYDSPDGETWTSRYDVATASLAPTAADVALGADTRFVRLVAYFNSGVIGANVSAEIENIRVLGATTSEDIGGGLYPHTVLADLVGQVPGLEQGRIDKDTSFALQQLSRAQRDKARSVVEEVATYFRKRWAVWEDRRFDWREPALDEAQWIVPLAPLTTCKLTTSVDNQVRTVYISYQDVATGQPDEQPATSTDRRNDYVRSGQQKDEVLAASVGMTAASAAALAQRVAEDHGSLPAVRGTIRLPAFTMIPNQVGVPQPACYIRAGDNILLPELPKTDMLAAGRDGQTLFNVTSAQTDMTETEQTTLELEGYSRTSDILQARLASATRVLTG